MLDALPVQNSPPTRTIRMHGSAASAGVSLCVFIIGRKGRAARVGRRSCPGIPMRTDHSLEAESARQRRIVRRFKGQTKQTSVCIMQTSVGFRALRSMQAKKRGHSGASVGPDGACKTSFYILINGETSEVRGRKRGAKNPKTVTEGDEILKTQKYAKVSIDEGEGICYNITEIPKCGGRCRSRYSRCRKICFAILEVASHLHPALLCVLEAHLRCGMSGTLQGGNRNSGRQVWIG